MCTVYYRRKTIRPFELKIGEYLLGDSFTERERERERGIFFSSRLVIEIDHANLLVRMFLSYVTIDLRRLLALQLAIRTFEPRFVATLVLVMTVTVTFQRETVQTPGTVMKQTILDPRRVPGCFRRVHQRVQHGQI